MMNIFKFSWKLISLSASGLGISCDRKDNVLRIEIDLNTLIYAAIIFTAAAMFIFAYNLIKEKFVHPKSSTDF